MKFTNAFLARYATRAPSGVWAGDSFVSTWQAASLPEQATLAIVWTCTFEDAELGNAFTFEFSMTDPAETVEVFGNTAAVPTRPPFPCPTVAIVEMMAWNFWALLKVEGLHWFDIRCSDGTAAPRIPLWVQAPVPHSPG
jgi:hypothetical protein